MVNIIHDEFTGRFTDQKRYSMRHPERVRRIRKRWWKKHPEKQHQYYMNNKDKIIRRSKVWASTHPEIVKETRRRWISRNRKYVRKIHKRWWKRHPEKYHEYYLRYKRKAWFAKIKKRNREMSRFYEHRIRKEDFEALLTLQRRSCAICGNGFASLKDCHIDHDHTSANIRGLLCQKCNIGLGAFRDNVNFLERAIKYLRGELSPIRQVSIER